MKSSKLEEDTKSHKAIDSFKSENLEGYPSYPISEDIYTHDEKLDNLNPEDLSKNKAPNEKEGSYNEKSFKEDMFGDDLDIPGSELDNQQEKLGNEDEENKYYSLGGDEQNNLDEDRN